MPVKVLDSWALMALFNDEPAADAVEQLLVQAAAHREHLLLCVINWTEIYYSVMKGHAALAAEEKARQIAELPVDLVPVSGDLALARQAAIFKATYRISLADAFAAALAKLRKAELITGDPEFKPLDGEIKLRWLPTGA